MFSKTPLRGDHSNYTMLCDHDPSPVFFVCLAGSTPTLLSETLLASQGDVGLTTDLPPDVFPNHTRPRVQCYFF